MTAGMCNTQFVMSLLHQLQRLSREPFYGAVAILKINATPGVVTAQLESVLSLQQFYPHAELKERDGQQFYELHSDGYRLVWQRPEETSDDE